MLKLLNLLFSWFSRTSFGIWVFHNIIGKFSFRRFSYPSFPIEDFFKIVDLILKNNREDVEKKYLYCFASCDTLSLAGKLITMTISSSYSHAGVIMPRSDLRFFDIAHMKGEGFLEWHMLELLKEIDNLVVVAIPLEVEQYNEVEKRLNFLRKYAMLFKYDFSQELDSASPFLNIQETLSRGDITKLYCSELIYVLLKDILHLEPKKFLGRLIFDPVDVLSIPGAKILYERKITK